MQLVEIVKYVFKLWVWVGKLFLISLKVLASQMASASVCAYFNEDTHV